MDYVGFVLNQAGKWLEHWFTSTSAADFQASDEVEWVEFIGGPLDGYQHAVDSTRLYHLPPAITIPINCEKIARLSTDDPDEIVPVEEPPSQHNAVYDLVPHGVNWRYHFAGQFVANDDNLAT
ncbi:hypothetical protein [Aporhodopirellula aestuarii]|uniref:Uncharacterized protein n=1 Tax=Aporhodopirellula aestuarii TaxID=2950107 RepID=A0ABT0U9M3_9BACT|nr:hypothetical protein [Aporhodopirellula aestuarii]MCM2373677.1 hypothetical protein [Aporhodopirellula aestuarii]